MRHFTKSEYTLSAKRLDEILSTLEERTHIYDLWAEDYIDDTEVVELIRTLESELKSQQL